MSMNDAERMITVAELLRREGFKQSAASRKRQKLAVAATGVVALAGATVTGMLVLAPKLSTSFSTEDGQLPVSSGNGGSAATPSTSDARKAGPAPATFVDVTTMAAVREAADAPELPVRIPAMSQIDRGDPAGERARDTGRASSAPEHSAEPAPTQENARRSAEGSEKPAPRDNERRGSHSAESTESQAAQPPADEETRQPADEEAQQSEPEQPPSKQKPEREKQAAGSDKGSDEGSEKGSNKGSDQGKGAGNGKGR